MLTSSGNSTMTSMENSLYELYKKGNITQETALLYATNPEVMKRKLNIR